MSYIVNAVVFHSKRQKYHFFLGHEAFSNLYNLNLCMYLVAADTVSSQLSDIYCSWRLQNPKYSMLQERNPVESIQTFTDQLVEQKWEL